MIWRVGFTTISYLTINYKIHVMKKEKLLSVRFEPLSEEAENLLGGFSSSLSASSFEEGSGAANNCNGGNCVAGCGSGQEVNTHKDCGVNVYGCSPTH